MASGVVLLAVLPLLVGPFLGWGTVFPLGRFPDGVLALWAAIALLGAALCAVALSRTVARTSYRRGARVSGGAADELLP